MIKWKTIGEKLFAVIQGKTVTVTEPQQVEKIKGQIKDYNENPDNEKLKEIEYEVHAEKNEEATKLKKEIIDTEKQAVILEEKVAKHKGSKKRSSDVEELLKTNIDPEYFILSETGKLQLLDQPYDIPRPLAIEFAERKLEGKSFLHLINFWKLLLLTPNAQARQDAFKYLTKQGMTITKQGYFLTYRRVHLKKAVSPKAVIKESHTISKDFLAESVDKVKRWKGSQKGYFIIATGDIELPFKLTRKDKLKAGDNNLGSLFSFIENDGGATVKKTSDSVTKVRNVYTDNHTKTFEIEIGNPVQMPREKTNENNKIECSNGLHVGTPHYVRNNSWLGEIILACIVNPMHIVSVPYDDAHKMRVCEYLPIKIISDSEITTFENSDLSEYEYAYMAHEAKEMEKLLKAAKGQINILDEGLFDSFTKYQSVQDLTDLQAKIEELKQHVVELRLNNDPISKELDLKSIEAIISSRLIAQ